MPELPPEFQLIIDKIPGLERTEPLKQLHGGETSVKWLLRAENQSFVLRIDRPIAGELGLDRRSEAAILEVVGAAGIGPRLIWASPGEGIQLCTFVEGEPWTREDTRNPALLSALARTLSRLHGLPVIGNRFDPAGAAKRYADEIATGEAAQLASRVHGLVDELYNDGRPLALCHNDLVHTNLVGRDPVRLIDWEYAANGDPYFDLAIVIRHHGLPRLLANDFLAEYERGAGAVCARRLQKNCELYDLLAALWYESLLDTADSSPTFRSEWRRAMLRLSKNRPDS